jgi:hypothetical protein
MKFKFIVVLLLVSMLVIVGCTPTDTTEEVEPPQVPAEPAEPADDPDDETAEDPDAVSHPTQSVVVDEDSLIEGLSAEGGWIVIFGEDMSTEQELVLEEGPTDNGEPTRKLALYTQDADRNVLERFTLTTPQLTIESPNSRIQGGTLAGDVIVDAENFQLTDAVIEGNLIFTSQEYHDSFENDGEVTGEIMVEES